MDENNRNFILAIVLAMVVLFAWQFFFVPPTPPEEQKTAQSQKPSNTAPPRLLPRAKPRAPGAAAALPSPRARRPA